MPPAVGKMSDHLIATLTHARRETRTAAVDQGKSENNPEARFQLRHNIEAYIRTG